ncbi:Clp protease [Frankia sp. Ag45/Mut15]|uniref:Clp protease n=1 Tax=Frankia umida TaxID=573489 RepID=A0ABT0JSY5_9ACTN|nr:Clp protease N-terminal domain-containing protein [Frankia umida]MCK9874651.1 Clp protease [Frankia umida]
MFERFTSAARQVVVLAQEESRGLDHNYIGTEHLLLGLLAETDGIAAQALTEIDLTLEMTRSRVVAAVGRGKNPVKGHIPFTPRAKKVLEKGLREAVSLRHNRIGTEHLLLGLLAVTGGVSARLLAEWNVDLDQLRARILVLAAEVPDRATGRPGAGDRRHARRGGFAGGADAVPLGLSAGGERTPRRTSAADAGIAGAQSLAGADPVGSHHLLLALLADPDSAATRTLTGLGLDLAAARDALRQTDPGGTSDELPEVTGRRGMSLRLTGSAVVVEATDRRLLELARLAFTALTGRRTPPTSADVTSGGTTPGADTGHGDLPVTDQLLSGRDELAESLSAVWSVLEASLEDIRARAAGAPTRPTAPTPGPAGTQDDPRQPEA